MTFRLGTNPDIATVQTQNRVNIAMPRLPPEVQRQGVVVKKVSTAFLTSVSLVSPDSRYDSLFLTNYAQINLLNQLASLEGVGECAARRRPGLLHARLGEPRQDGATGSHGHRHQRRHSGAEPAESRRIASASRLARRHRFPVFGERARDAWSTPAEFDDIVLRAQPGHRRCCASATSAACELGAADLQRLQPRQRQAFGQPHRLPFARRQRGGHGRPRPQVHGADARRPFPPGMDYVIPYDSTVFVRAAISEVMMTLFEAIGLVILVVFLFLQNWRATLIPLLTVPVAIVGTFALFPLLGFSINITSMFGLVLAIGIVVDDAIVVVEAVQRHIDDGMAPREATIRAMEEVSAPVVAIACILAAVFIPVAFLGGISGQIYKQFALTIAASVLISAFNALSLSPALSAMLLRPKMQTRGPLGRFFDGFNRAFEWTRNRYLAGVAR